MKTLQQYLDQAIRDGNLQHTLSVVYQAEDALDVGFTGIGFILHPASVSGETLTFVVQGNQLRTAEFPQKDGTVLIDYGLSIRLGGSVRSTFEGQTCVGCDQQAVALVTIGQYRLWMCESHARQTQDTLNFIVPQGVAGEAR